MDITTRKMLEKAQENINKAVEFIEDHNYLFESMDLKMYKAFCYDMEDYPLLKDNATELFYDWCNREYEIAEEFLKDKFKIDFSKIRRHIGATSSFYLIDKDLAYCNIREVICQLLYDYLYHGFNYTDLTDDYILIPYRNYEWCDNEVMEEIEDIANGFDEYVEKYFEDAITVYNYIHDFKKNQVQYFKDYLEFENDDMVFYLKEEKEKLEADVRKANEIVDKYNITKEDIFTLKKSNVYIVII